MLTRRFWNGLLLATLLPCTGRAAALSVAVQPLPPTTTIDLSAEAEYDWTHWGLVDATSYDHLEFSDQIGNFTLLGTNAVQRVSSIGVGYSWTNGTPTTTATATTTAVSVTGLTDGFQLTIPADTFLKRLQVYVGTFQARGKFEAILSDGSLPIYVDNRLDSATGETNAVYVIDYATTNDSQTLTIKFTVQQAYSANGRVILQSAVFRSSPFNSFPSVTLTNPTNDANLSASSPISLTAAPLDTDGTIRLVEFFDGALKIGEATNSPFSLAWTNAPLGFHTLTATATDNLGDSSEAPPVTIFVYGSGGTMSGAVGTPGATVDLTAEGTYDWAHWGLASDNSFDHKQGVAPQISNFVPVTFGPAYRFTDNSHAFTWYDGTPTATATNTTTGLYITGLQDGFEFNVVAQTNLSTLKIYAGAFAAQGKLTAFLSDKSGPAFFDSSLLNAGNGPNAMYTLNYKAASPGQILTVRYTIAARTQISGNVTLIAASLATENLPPFVAITNLTNHTVFQSPASIPINTFVNDPDGTVTKVEYFDGTTKLGERISIPFNFVFTNATLGNHFLTARATDNKGTTYTTPPLSVFVTSGGGTLNTSLGSPPASLNLSVEGRTDWAHWGLNNANSFVHRSGVPQRISDITAIGGGTIKRLTDFPTTFSWNNGTPTPNSAGTPTGIYIGGLTNGFQITLPADRNLRRLKVYVGLYGARGRFEASLTDFSAAEYSDTSLNNVFANSAGVYTIDFASASSNQILTVKYTVDTLYDVDFGNVTLESATLAVPAFSVQNPQRNGSSFSLSFLTEPERPYSVEYSDVIPGTNWITLTNVIGNGAVTNIAVPTGGNAQRFFRAKETIP